MRDDGDDDVGEGEQRDEGVMWCGVVLIDV